MGFSSLLFSSLLFSSLLFSSLSLCLFLSICLRALHLAFQVPGREAGIRLWCSSGVRLDWIWCTWRVSLCIREAQSGVPHWASLSRQLGRRPHSTGTVQGSYLTLSLSLSLSLSPSLNLPASIPPGLSSPRSGGRNSIMVFKRAARGRYPRGSP